MTTVPHSADAHLPLQLDDGVWMLCPVCGMNHAKIIGAGVQPHNTREGWRGPHTFSRAVMEFEGECGHRWEIAAMFSKGQVHLTVNAEGEQL